MSEPTFELVPLRRLRPHEEIEPGDVNGLAHLIERLGVLENPIWVARGSGVILNGHHRVAALIALGAERVPAWVFDYEDPRIRLDRWSEGPPVSKAEVIERGRDGRPFPPKTTKHSIEIDLPPRPTRLEELRGAAPDGAQADPATPRGDPGAPRSSARPRPAGTAATRPRRRTGG